MQDYTNNTESVKKSKVPIIIAVIVIVIALIAGIVLFMTNNSNKTTEIPITPTAAPSPSPTTAPVIDKETVKIHVLNGTGTPGQATKVAVALKNAGYNLDNIKTGNSPDEVAVSTVAYKAGFLGVAENIQSVLSSDFSDIKVSSTELSADGEYDIVVTTGGKQFVAPTSTGSTTPTPTGASTTPTPTSNTTPTPTPTSTPPPTPTP